MKRSAGKPTRNRVSLRATVLGVFFGLWLVVIAAKVVHVQVFQGDLLSQKASRQYKRSVQVEGKRGIIYDCNGREMAASIDVASIAADPGQLEDVGQASTVLAKALEIDRKTLVKSLSKDRSFVWVQRKVTPKKSAAVAALQLGGIHFLSEPKRYYPGPTLAAQVLGFTGIDGNGLEGIEYRYNEQLSGNRGKKTVLKEVFGFGFATEGQSAESTDGSDLVLTIDLTIQFLAEQALEGAVKETDAKDAIAVVMDPDSGAILAMAHYPVFNPNVFSKFEKRTWRNRAITDFFEPGSTMKIFTAAAAIEKGGFTRNSIFFCENGAYTIASDTIHDTHEYEWLTLEKIVKYSSNIGAAKVLKEIGPETLYTTLRAFGFGEKTGIDCPGETAGCLAPYQKWRGVKAANISFGQGLSVSAIQLAAAVNTIANGGKLMRPYVVQRVVDGDGNDVKRFEPEAVRQVVSPGTARTVAEMMKTVTTEGGTGESAALEGYSVAGKTGTAEKPGESGTYEKGLYVSSFVGFVPADDPCATIVVIVNEPKTEHYGGVVAGPAFRKIAEGLLQYLNVAPSSFPVYSPEQDMDSLTVSREHGARG